MKSNNKSFIVDFWETIFKILSYISVFQIIRLLKKDISYRFVEIWVISNLFLAIFFSLIVYYIDVDIKLFYYSFIIYGALRVFEIIIYQLNVLLFDPYRATKKNISYKIKSPTRLVILLFHNYFEIICWFTVSLICFLKLEQEILNPWISYIKINFWQISILDSKAIFSNYKNIPFGGTMMIYETIVGYIITIITMARFIGILPPVDSIDKV